MANSLDRREPFAGIVELHERMGHPIRIGALGRQAFCVHCNLLWSAHQGWYSTDVVDPLSDAPGIEDDAAA